MMLAPVVRGRKGEYKKDLEKLARQGFVRARIDGVLRSLDEEIPLDRRKNHTIEVVVDRLLVKPGIEKRLEASIETATKLADGLVLVAVVNGEERLYSQKLACPECGTSIPQLEPRSFSFNSPYGACEECTRAGQQVDVRPGQGDCRLRRKPLLDGGLGPGGRLRRACSSSWRKPRGRPRIDLAKPFEELPKKAQATLLDGTAASRAFSASCRRPSTRARRRLPRVAARSTCRRRSARPARASGCGRPAWPCG